MLRSWQGIEFLQIPYSKRNSIFNKNRYNDLTLVIGCNTFVFFPDRFKLTPRHGSVDPCPYCVPCMPAPRGQPPCLRRQSTTCARVTPTQSHHAGQDLALLVRLVLPAEQGSKGKKHRWKVVEEGSLYDLSRLSDGIPSFIFLPREK